MIKYSDKDRIIWIRHYEINKNVRFTCKLFGISPDTFYKWKRRYNGDVKNLNDTLSRRPTKTRRKWNHKDLLLLKRLYDYQPDISLISARRFLKKNNVALSASTIYRMKLVLDRLN